MYYRNLDTPCIVVDLDKLEKNINYMQKLANSHNLELWPMIKTHKSQYIVEEQLKAGAKGILVAKLSEAEKLVAAGVKRVMLAYPIIGENKLERLCKLAKGVEVYCSVDSVEAAIILNEKAKEKDLVFNTIIIVDSGLRRLGIQPHETKGFYNRIKELKNIEIVGVATHGGHVYGATDKTQVDAAAQQEVSSIKNAVNQLEEIGVSCKVAAIGSTPTIKALKDFEGIKQIRPGNYVFHDTVQMALGAATEESCSLSVLATIISIPEGGRAVMDAGSKILCLDAGAHGNDHIKGFGRIKGYPDIVIKGLSEELGRLEYNPERVKLEIGQVIEIIPNHSCTVVNTADKLYGIRNNQLEREIEVTARGMTF
ncbi:alanine racemase [Alkaliphilus serpentinus]|uniref:Amino-acid racemase n=1 Tax=Alkaliphilus serpentinus TaxID=1482731 RepID=A0A833M768_9FIRM|nr:alanine racemase [Alkaliphilus serpentinus]KAB3529802.1 amino-acid racemase [Alkaliphilus serpentinus]